MIALVAIGGACVGFGLVNAYLLGLLDRWLPRGYRSVDL